MSALSEFFNMIGNLSVAAASFVAIIGVESWREQRDQERKTTLAEEALTTFYRFRSSINHIRNPFVSIPLKEGEKASDLLNNHEENSKREAKVYTDRISHEQDVFSSLYTLRFRCKVTLGDEAAQVFDDSLNITNEVHASLKMVFNHFKKTSIDHYSEKQKEKYYKDREYHDKNIYAGYKDDPINQKLDEIEQRALTVFREYIDTPQTPIALIRKRLSDWAMKKLTH